MRTIQEIKASITPEMDAKIRQSVIDNKLQDSIDEMLKLPQYKQYVQQAKLHLLGNDFGELDALLTLGYLKGYNPGFKGF